MLLVRWSRTSGGKDSGIDGGRLLPRPHSVPVQYITFWDGALQLTPGWHPLGVAGQAAIGLCGYSTGAHRLGLPSRAHSALAVLRCWAGQSIWHTRKLPAQHVRCRWCGSQRLLPPEVLEYRLKREKLMAVQLRQGCLFKPV